jgi:hypothetical protein
MARLAGAVLVAASLGTYGPRAQRYAAETSRSARGMGDDATAAGQIAAGGGGSFFSFIPATLSAVDLGASEVPSLAADFGDTKVQQQLAEQNQQTTEQTQLAAQVVVAPLQAQEQAAKDQRTEVAYVAGALAFGAAAIALAVAAKGGKS